MATNAYLNLVTEAYADMVIARYLRGFTGTFLTFMFHPLPGSEQAKIEQMFDEAERCNSLLLSRCYRLPRKIPDFDKPFWLVSPDWPVQKTGFDRDHFVNIEVNDGLHLHAVVMLPPDTKLKRQSLADHIDDHQQLYRPPHGVIMNLHAVPITETPQKAVGYAVKSVPRRRIGEGDVLILPRLNSEMPSMTKAERRWHNEERKRNKGGKS